MMFYKTVTLFLFADTVELQALRRLNIQLQESEYQISWLYLFKKIAVIINAKKYEFCLLLLIPQLVKTHFDD